MENISAKITITQIADKALESAQARVNKDFDGGRVNKSEMASYLLIYAVEALTPAQIEKIRQAYFDPVKYLESLLKKLKTSGEAAMTPEEMARIKSLIGPAESKKKSKVDVSQSPESARAA